MKKKLVSCLLFTCIMGFAETTNNKTDAQLINELKQNWINSLAHKQLSKAMDLYTDEAIFYSPGSKGVAGKKAISKLYEEVIRKFTSHCTFTSSGIIINGNQAYDSGSYSETLLDAHTHKTIRISGNYLMILQKKETTAWRISRIMWTQWK